MKGQIGKNYQTTGAPESGGKCLNDKEKCLTPRRK